MRVSAHGTTCSPLPATGTTGAADGGGPRGSPQPFHVLLPLPRAPPPSAQVAQKTGLKGTLLERRLEAMSEALEMKEAQLAEVLTAANLDPSTLQVRAPGVPSRACDACTLPPAHALTRAPGRGHDHTHLHHHHHRNHTTQAINKRLEEVLENKNMLVKALQYDVAKVSKAHNDLIRVYEAKLAEFGIPVEELGFRPLVTNTTAGPAGLVVGA